MKSNKENRLKCNIPHTLTDVSRRMRKLCWEMHKGIYWIYFHCSSDISWTCSVSDVCWSRSLKEAVSLLFFSPKSPQTQLSLFLHSQQTHCAYRKQTSFPWKKNNTLNSSPARQFDLQKAISADDTLSNTSRRSHQGEFQTHFLYFPRHCEVCVCVSFI